MPSRAWTSTWRRARSSAWWAPTARARPPWSRPWRASSIPPPGTAEVLGFTPWQRKNAFRRQIALIMGQKAQLWWDLPAGDGFLLLREIYQMPEDRFQANAGLPLTERSRVKDKLNIQIRRLCLGERMKMELIAALLHSAARGVPGRAHHRPRPDRPARHPRVHPRVPPEGESGHDPHLAITWRTSRSSAERIVLVAKGELVYDGSVTPSGGHATHKVLTVHLRAGPGGRLLAPGAVPAARHPAGPAGLGEVVESDGQVDQGQGGSRGGAGGLRPGCCRTWPWPTWPSPKRTWARSSRPS